MKKAVFCIGIFLLATMLIGCGTMNTRFRPYMEVKQEIQDVKAIVTRADRSGIYLALKNESKQEMEILWKDSKLGGDEVTHGTHLNLNDQRAERERSEEHTSELQSRQYLVCRLLLEKKKKNTNNTSNYII